MEKGRQAAIYCRISLDADGDRLGVARQETDCRDLADRLGWDVVAVHVDNSISAYGTKKRPGYQALLADLEAGTVDALVVWKPDRLHRRPVELEHFIDLVERRRIEIATVAGGTIDLTTSEGRAMARVVGTFARMESEVKSDRTRRKHLELAERGVPVGGIVRPFGYEDDKVTVRPDERALVQEAAARILAGGTVRGLARDWNARGLVTPLGNRWSQTSIRRVLTAWRSAGVRALADQPVAYDAWEPLLDAETHARLRAVLLAPGRTRGGYGPRTHVLTGLLVCWRCKRRLIARPQSNRRRTYVCSSNPDTGGCGGVRIVADDLEDYIADLVFAHVDGPDYAAALGDLAYQVVDDPVPEVQACEAKLRDLAEAWAADAISRDEWITARRSVEARLAAARKRLAPAANRPTPGSGVLLRDRWKDDMDVDTQHAHLRTLIDRIEIGPATPGCNRFDHTRAQVTWLL